MKTEVKYVISKAGEVLLGVGNEASRITHPRTENPPIRHAANLFSEKALEMSVFLGKLRLACEEARLDYSQDERG